MSRNFNKNPVTVEEIVKDLLKVALESGAEANSLTTRQYSELGGQFSKDQILRKGGWTLIKSQLPAADKELDTVYKLKSQKAYTSKLENVVGAKLNIEDLVKKVIEGLDVKIAPRKKQKATSENTEKVQMVAMLNDLHYGLRVDSEENGGLNSYDFKEAGRRTALFIKEIADYKPHKRKNVEKLHLILNGDIIEGILRGGQGNEQHLLTHQINGAVHILSHALEFLRRDFKKIDIHCLAGNHDRMVHKNAGHRPTSEIYDSYANIIYYSLSAIFKSDKNVIFIIPKTPYGFINLPAGRLMYLHGDGLWAKQLGNPGKTLNVRVVSEAIREFNAGELAKGNESIKMVLVGHTHNYCHYITSDGVEVCVAPSLCGINGYAHMLNINNNSIAQLVFESTKDFIFGDSRLVRLGAADNNTDFDKIIPVYNKELTL